MHKQKTKKTLEKRHSDNTRKKTREKGSGKKEKWPLIHKGGEANRGRVNQTKKVRQETRRDNLQNEAEITDLYSKTFHLT